MSVADSGTQQITSKLAELSMDSPDIVPACSQKQVCIDYVANKSQEVSQGAQVTQDPSQRLEASRRRRSAMPRNHRYTPYDANTPTRAHKGTASKPISDRNNPIDRGIEPTISVPEFGVQEAAPQSGNFSWMVGVVSKVEGNEPAGLADRMDLDKAS